MKNQLKKAVFSMLAIATIATTVQAVPTPESIQAITQELSVIFDKGCAKQYLETKGASRFEGLSKPGIRNLATIIAHNPKTKSAYDHRRGNEFPLLPEAVWIDAGIGINVPKDSPHEPDIYLMGFLKSGDIGIIEVIILRYITEQATWVVGEEINYTIFIPNEAKHKDVTGRSRKRSSSLH